MSRDGWALSGLELLQPGPVGQRWRSSGGWGSTGAPEPRRGAVLACGGQGWDVAPGPWRVPAAAPPPRGCPFLWLLLYGNKAPSTLPRVSAPQEAGGGGRQGRTCRRRNAAGPARGGAGSGGGAAMARPVLLAAAALLLLPPPLPGTAVTRLRVSANFVSAGRGGRGQRGAGGAALTAVSLLAGVPGHR